MTHTYHAEYDGCGSYIVRDEFGHAATRFNGSLAQYACQANADTFAAILNRSAKCSNCDSPEVTELPALIPSGTRHRVLCANGHATNGIPSRDERIRSRERGATDYSATLDRAHGAR